MKSRSALCVALAAFCGMATAAAPHWDYTEQETWGELQDITQTTPPLMYPFAGCALGQHQSPVDLAGAAKTTQTNHLKWKYAKDQPDFYNSGHAIQVNVSAGHPSSLMIGADEYPLVQYHLHSPSEHVIGDKTYPAELHFVHIRADGKAAVVGVLIEEGAENLAIGRILKNMPTTSPTHTGSTGTWINPAWLLPIADLGFFYTYAGSLTTPPCSEGVNWYVLSQPITMSAAQLVTLQTTFYNNNNRFSQPLNGRVVTGKLP